jgi:hypothetical protein
MAFARRSGPLALLAALALAYFAGLALHPSHTLYADHSDLIALHVPWETFLARAWRATGERPLWNPLQFSGLPFAHDVQAATFYPPHLVFRWTGEGGVGPALSWLIVAHVVIAGWGTYAYARSTGLEPTAGFVAAAGFMFAGKWLLHLLLAGHYAFAGLAWLPWALLGLDRAIAARSLVAATWGGVAFGMLAISTHPQLTLYSGLFLAIWTFPSVLDAEIHRVWSRLGCWTALGLWVAAVGVALAAVQLLPALEATPMASRGVSGMPESPTFSPRALLRTIGPSPDGVQPVVSWEPRSGLGVVWVAVAVAAPILARGRDRRRARWALGTALGLAAFALGGAALFQSLPGFRLFRQPARIFLVAGLPIAYLGGIATQALLDRPGPPPESRAKARRVVARVSLGLIAWMVVAALATGFKGFRPHPYWFSLILTVPLALRLIGIDADRIDGRWRVAWVGVLLVDLVAQTWPYLRTRDLEGVLAPSTSARFVAEHAGPLDRVLDRSLPGHQSSTPLGPAVASRLGLHQVRGYNALDLVRYKEFLALISDPIPIKNPYNGLINAPILHKPLLDLLGVRFLVQPADPSLRSAVGEPDLDPRWHRVATDPAPSAFTFAAGGVRVLPPYEVLENGEAFPRAFVVPEVERLSNDRAGIVRAMTTTDFRRVALVESSGPLGVGPGTGPFRPATVVSYRPNRVEIEADGPGLLVLADPWYPGWLATVDGSPAPILRADYLFRGVALPPGRHAVTFAFRPRSYAIGRTISLATIGLVALVTGCSLVIRKPRLIPSGQPTAGP